MTTPTRGKRHKLRTGIYADRYGISAIVTVGPLRDEARFPIDTAVTDIEVWRLQRRAELLKERGTVGRRGTLAGDIRVFLPSIPAGRRRIDYENLLRHWRDSPLGTQPRWRITEIDIRTQLAAWETAGVAASTRRHRLRAIRVLYRRLDGRGAANPAAGITIRQSKSARPRDVPIALIEQLLANMPDRGRPVKAQRRSTVSHTKIRLRVMAWTGLPQMQLERLRQTDVNFVVGTMRLQPRDKGAGSPAAVLPLIPPALAALRDYAAAKLWEQRFSRDSMNASWKRTLARTRRQIEAAALETGDPSALHAFDAAIPDGCRPYDLRHSFLSEAYRRTGDLRAVAELGQHADLRTTRRYTEGAVSERAAAAIAAMSVRWETKR